MMAALKDKITTSQAAIIVTNFILGIGILTLPRVSVEKVKTPDVWLSVIIGGLIAMIIGAIVGQLCRMHPGKTFYQFSMDIMGKWFGRLLNILVAAYFLYNSATILRSMSEIIKLLLLEGTPTWAIMMSFMWVGVYLIIGGINPIARLSELIFPITVVVYLVTILMGLGLFEIGNLRPVLGLGIMPVLKGLKTTALPYSGFEIMFIISAFMSKPDKAIKAALIGIAVPMIYYLITVVIVIGVLSVDGVVDRTWPTIDLLRSFELTGIFFERYESLFLILWIMHMYATYTVTHYAAALGLAQLFQKDIHPFIYGLLPAIYILATIPKTINDIFKSGTVIGNVAFFLFGVMPLLLLLVSRLRRRPSETIA
ncbi:spore germination protein [Paenibacillus sp. MBLB4367]|uniref:spore germination protein n=1 Tax=Paenibacillus sp. MBLB4367 TaxID=3384767 RepID=UPI003907F627